jgi:hypothetical protein
MLTDFTKFTCLNKIMKIPSTKLFAIWCLRFGILFLWKLIQDTLYYS